LHNPLLAEILTTDKAMQPAAMLVVIDGGLLSSQPQLLEKVTAYAQHYQQAICLKASPLAVVGGEAAKNDSAWVEQIQRLISEVRLCRHSYVVVIGGGAVLDMVGYAAATSHRGVRLIRVPTTVLAQDDSGIGVKNGVNAFGKKNFLGTFAPPYAVINDADFLRTLGQRDWIAGVIEAIKVALIKDADFFQYIEASTNALVKRELSVMQHVIYRSCQHHLHHISNCGDPFEMGSSRPLDFGHWAAHRLEHLTNYRLRHGEAVAIGIALDSTYAYFAGLLPAEDWRRILSTLQALGFALYVPELGAFSEEPEHSQSIFRGLTEFREHLGGELTLMLLAGIGTGVEVHQINLELYRQAIAYLKALD
jgi:3-dehydroquinate synthase